MDKIECFKIRNDNFQATVHISSLLDLPRSKFRKMLKIMAEAPGDNEAEFRVLREQLSLRVEMAQAEWDAASQLYVNGWRYVENKYSRHPDVVAILSNNRRLSRNVKHAKARHNGFVALKAICDAEAPKFN